MIVVRSHIAYGAPHAVDTSKAHGAPLGEPEVRATKEALGWDPDAHFVVPPEVYEHMNGAARGRQHESEWQASSRPGREAFPEAREQWDDAWAGRIGAVDAARVRRRRGARDPRRRQDR